MSLNLYNNTNNIQSNQNIYDSYNNFIMSADRNVFNKLIVRSELYHMTRHLAGDIVECGVFKGSGLLSWLKLVNLYHPHSIKKVIGFDMFDPSFVATLDNDTDKKMMKEVFDRVANLDNNDISLKGIENKILAAGFTKDKFDLVKGDISVTSHDYIKDRPGFRISLLYLDLDLDKPTYDTLEALWSRVVEGGLVVFDEYAYHMWSEANAVDRFFKDKHTKLINLNVASPTAYVIKS